LAKKASNLTYEELKSFNYACLLHDIGKINIPDQILMKPSKLTKEEFEIIKSHPIVGAEAIKNVDGLGENICVIRSHHERWDGSGYPDRFKGEEIPFLARVTAIADAFDAMTSSRSYRAAMPVDKAYQHILEAAGTQFDPNLVEEFKVIFPKWVEFHKNYPWSKECELQRVVRS
jgi:HD-GYP domain-containing protein (c-di-GMP phosphodiesterase class II)